jgi:hypothetical protein
LPSTSRHACFEIEAANIDALIAGGRGALAVGMKPLACHCGAAGKRSFASRRRTKAVKLSFAGAGVDLLNSLCAASHRKTVRMSGMSAARHISRMDFPTAISAQI